MSATCDAHSIRWTWVRQRLGEIGAQYFYQCISLAAHSRTDNELSSDDDALMGGASGSGNAFVHSIEEEEHPDVDAREAERYGIAYARYKARLRRELNDKSVDAESNDDKPIGSDSD